MKKKKQKLNKEPSLTIYSWGDEQLERMEKK